MKNDILFLSILYPRDECVWDKYVKKHRGQNISAIQYALLEGLSSNESTECTVLNTLLVPLFPIGYKLPIVRGQKFSIEHIKESKCFSYLNVRGLYTSSLFYGAKKHLKQWANKKNESKIAIAYSLTSYTVKAMHYLKRVNPNIKTMIIVPDLPEYTYRESTGFLKKTISSLGKKRIEKSLQKNLPFVDKLILFSEKMNEKLNASSFTVFDGIATEDFKNIKPERLFPDDIIEILYAGGLNESYGVQLLLDAFNLLKSNQYKLILAGRGPMQEKIKKYAEKNSKIIYLGEVPRSKLLSLEKGADVLINPRINSGIFTKYSFPSKNMEYLSSGVPTIGYPLEGMSDEYKKYINYFKEENATSLAETIEAVCETEHEIAKKRANEAQEFVFKNKNKKFWAEHIVQFANE